MAKRRRSLKDQVRDLKNELAQKDEILKLYADHRNWVRPSEVRERLGIPKLDRGGQTIDEPVQCFVGARYPWEPALKIMMGMPEEDN